MGALITLTQAHNVRERLLMYGGPGSGKSTNAATIMLHTPDVTHHVIDMEIDNYERLFAEDPMFQPLQERVGESIFIYPVDTTNWEEQLEAAVTAGAAAAQGDWWYFDMITDTWESVRSWYTDKIYGNDLADYFMDARKDLQNRRDKASSQKEKAQAEMQGLSGWEDYGIINPQYKKLYSALMNTKAHVCIIAEEDKVREGSGKAGEDRSTKAAFGHIGYKPKGQKKLGHIPQTVIRCSRHAKNGWQIECAKDRGREGRWEEEFGSDKEGAFGEDFAKFYFPTLAGWKKGLVRT